MAQELHRDSDENNKHTPKGFTAGALSSYPVKSEKGLSVYDKRNVLPQAINFVDGNAAPPTTASGDIYVLIDLGNGAVNAGWGASVYNDWTRSDGSAYFPITPLVGDLCNSAAGDWYKFDGAQWVLFGVGATDTNISNANLSLDAARTTDMNGFNLTIDNTGAAATLGIHNETTDFGTAGSGLRLLASGGAFQMLSTSRTGAQEFFVLHTPTGQTTFSHAPAQGFRVIEDVGGQVQMLLQNNQFALAPTIEPISKFYVLGQGTDNTTNNLFLRNAGLNPLLTVKNGGEIVIGQTPTTDNANNNILVRDGVTGAIELRDASTIGSSIYVANGTIGSGRVATITDTLNFAGGSIGLGITPTAKLHVKTTNTTAGTVAFKIENGSNIAFARFLDDRTFAFGGDGTFTAATNYAYEFRSNSNNSLHAVAKFRSFNGGFTPLDIKHTGIGIHIAPSDNLGLKVSTISGAVNGGILYGYDYLGTAVFGLVNSGKTAIGANAISKLATINHPTAAYLNLEAATTGGSSLNLGNGVDPTTPENGDLWYNGTNLNFRSGGVTTDLLSPSVDNIYTADGNLTSARTVTLSDESTFSNNLSFVTDQRNNATAGKLLIGNAVANSSNNYDVIVRGTHGASGAFRDYYPLSLQNSSAFGQSHFIIANDRYTPGLTFSGILRTTVGGSSYGTVFNDIAKSEALGLKTYQFYTNRNGIAHADKEAFGFRYLASGISLSSAEPTLVMTTDNSVGIGVQASSVPTTTKMLVRGADLLSTSSALLVENSGGTDLLDVRNNGFIGVNVVPTAQMHIKSNSTTQGLFVQTNATGGSNYGIRVSRSDDALVHIESRNDGVGIMTPAESLVALTLKSTSGAAQGVIQAWKDSTNTEVFRAGNSGKFAIGQTAISKLFSANVAAAGYLNVAASTTGGASINLGNGVDPTTPQNGDIWFDGTDLKIRIAGVTRTVNVT